MQNKARAILRKALGISDANFRNGQWESIEGLLNRKRMLVVQRTGWGKSMVYFMATHLLRETGAGPTLLISPLLSLMRNQIEAAAKIGVKAVTINSANQDEWEKIEEEVLQDNIDVLIISPERLANDKFRANILSTIAERVGLFVVDEAHCISDWGHDFRPDYRRIVRVLQAIPSNVPVLATTATANDRVVADIVNQLGEGIYIVRGPLVRKSLRLQNIHMPSPATRMAWLTKTISGIDGSGIVYTLTQRDAERVSEWLKNNKINADAYHAGLSTDDKEHLEQQLLNNQIKVLVATVALGMGFDKPDIGFVIHFQRPASIVHYYQQVGRAGRAVNNAYGVLLCGEEDDHIAKYFISNSFPPKQHIDKILSTLDQSDDGLSVPVLEASLNLRKKQIDNTTKFLTMESPSPITKVGTKWHVTAAASEYKIDKVSMDAITAIREQEQKEMQAYMNHTGCLMEFVANALDDPTPIPCGKCVNCDSSLLLSENFDDDLVNQAALFLKRNYRRILPRKQWPYHTTLFEYNFSGRIQLDLQAEEGRALCLWRDAGWGQLVKQGKYNDNRFADELVIACVEMIKQWAPESAPEWVTCIPSKNHPNLVPDFAERLAKALTLPFIPCIEKTMDNQQQKFMENNSHQVRNLDGVFKVNLEPKPYAPCFLVDDVVDSSWTLTVASALLRQAGCIAVLPVALAFNSPRMD